MSMIDVYHRLPYPLKIAAATWRGRTLNRWRYGPETERLVEASREREQWDAAAWAAYRSPRLDTLLERAATRVPVYRDYWRAEEDTNARSWRDLASWPVLRKESVRSAPRDFLADDCDPRHMFEEHTSGSTGTPLSLWWSRETTQAWYALFEARIRRWHGVDRATRWANVGGQLVASATRDRPPFWVWNPAMRQLYLSSYHLTPQTVSAYLESLARHRIRYLLGYPSSLAAIAGFAREQGIDAPAMRVAISNAEPLYDHQRALIAEVFDCPVRDTYGMAEIACAASECRDGALHIWPEVGIIELLALDSDEAVAKREVGRIVATGLLNHDMPLIRYDTGDLGVRAPDDATCACGRSLPILTSVEGRQDDVITTPDGRRIGRLDPVFKADLPMRAAQIAQVAEDRLEVRVEPTDDWDDAAARAIETRLRQRVGPHMRIEIRTTPSLPRIAGKLRSVVREIGVREI